MAAFALFKITGLAVALLAPLPARTAAQTVQTEWKAPESTWVNDLSEVVNGKGVHGFVFSGSQNPDGVPYGTYNWCNMPHVRRKEYKRPKKGYKLEYVEVIHRHHKRTPYADNTFPHEGYGWECTDQGLFYYGKGLKKGAKDSAQTYWSVFESDVNPFVPKGFHGTCQFPQITTDGLEDSWQHGKDLYEVYRELLDFLPKKFDSAKVSFRVTSNVITSQVAGALIEGMFNPKDGIPILIQRDGVDSLQPTYPCSKASNLYSSYATGSQDQAWLSHLQASSELFTELDIISGVPSTDAGFHRSWDHYYDNLSARQCHSKPLPCSADKSKCVTQEQADAVYRLGQYEYSYTYRDRKESLEAATGSYGVWLAELASHIREKMEGKTEMVYRHNVAHDGSVSRLLSLLQLDEMVWPGMGSEVVFELYSSTEDKVKRFFVRVLWGGQTMKSSALGDLNMVDAKVFLGYVEGLTGRKSEKVKVYCG